MTDFHSTPDQTNPRQQHDTPRDSENQSSTLNSLAKLWEVEHLLEEGGDQNNEAVVLKIIADKIDDRKATGRPPLYTTADLITVALMLKGPLQLSQVRHWVLRCFQYLTKDSGDPFWQTIWEVNHDCACKSMRDYFLPIHSLGKSIAVNTSEARILAPHLFGIPPPMPVFDTRTCPLLDLPPEIRNKIWEYVVALPSSGLLVRGLRFLTRDYSKSHDMHAWAEARNDSSSLLHCDRSKDLLCWTRINKQIRNEALPIFYYINTLVFANVPDLTEYLSNLSRTHRNHISRISFIWEQNDQSSAPYAFAYLCYMMRNLQKLEIFFVDYQGYLLGKSGKLAEAAGLGKMRFGRKLEKIVLHAMYLSFWQESTILDQEMIHGSMG